MRPPRWAAAATAALLLAGCFDQWQIKERWLAMALAVDPAPAGVRLAVQVPPDAVSGGEGGGMTDPGLVLVADGPDYDSALTVLADRYSRRLMLGHARVYVFNAEVAKQGLGPLVSRLMRDPEVWPEAWLVVSQGGAGDILRVQARGAPISPTHVWRVLDVGRRTGVVPDASLARFFIDWRTPGIDPVAPVLRVAGELVTVEGIAIFRGHALVGILDPPDSDLLLLLLDRGRGSRLAVPCPGARAALHLVVWHARTEPRVWVRVGGAPAAVVQSRIDATVAANPCPELPSGAAVATQASRYLTVQVRRVLDRVQRDLGADVLGLGALLRGRYPAVYGSGGWEEAVRRMPVDVQVVVTVRHQNLFLGTEE